MPIVVKHTTNAATNITCINSFEQYVDDINTIKQIFTNTDNQNKNLHTAITFSLNVKSLCSFFCFPYRNRFWFCKYDTL